MLGVHKGPVSQEEVHSGPVAPTSWLWKAPDTHGIVYRATNLPYSPGTGGFLGRGPPCAENRATVQPASCPGSTRGERTTRGLERPLPVAPASRSPHAMPSPERPAPCGGLPSPTCGVITGEDERVDEELQI